MRKKIFVLCSLIYLIGCKPPAAKEETVVSGLQTQNGNFIELVPVYDKYPNISYCAYSFSIIGSASAELNNMRRDLSEISQKLTTQLMNVDPNASPEKIKSQISNIQNSYRQKIDLQREERFKFYNTYTNKSLLTVKAVSQENLTKGLAFPNKDSNWKKVKKILNKNAAEVTKNYIDNKWKVDPNSKYAEKGGTHEMITAHMNVFSQSLQNYIDAQDGPVEMQNQITVFDVKNLIDIYSLLPVRNEKIEQITSVLSKLGKQAKTKVKCKPWNELKVEDYVQLKEAPATSIDEVCTELKNKRPTFQFKHDDYFDMEGIYGDYIDRWSAEVLDMQSISEDNEDFSGLNIQNVHMNVPSYQCHINTVNERLIEGVAPRNIMNILKNPTYWEEMSPNFSNIKMNPEGEKILKTGGNVSFKTFHSDFNCDRVDINEIDEKRSVVSLICDAYGTKTQWRFLLVDKSTTDKMATKVYFETCMGENPKVRTEFSNRLKESIQNGNGLFLDNMECKMKQL